MIDQHCHSNISEDSQATLQSMCRGAIDGELDIISFTEHVDFNPADMGYLFFDAERYSREIDKCQQKFARDIKILKGVEFDAPHLYAREFEKVVAGDYDIILGSVHMIDGFFVGDRAILENMSLEVLFDKYYGQLLDLVNFGGIDVVAHFDFPKRYYKKKINHEEKTERILRAMIDKKIAMEINTSPIRKGYFETSPGRDILERYAALGGERITIGSDAHNPNEIGADFDYARTLIHSIKGLNEGYFEKRQFMTKRPS